MIPAVHARGTNVGGLLRYLFGPGRREEHTDPHIVASWLDAGDLSTTGVKELACLLEQPAAAGRKPPAKTVWHCSVRTHPSDRFLTDAQWGHIAGEIMAATGLAPHGDRRAVRWLAVRHAPDHIHLVATLVRQDRRTAWAWKDKLHAQQACRDLERRYGLRPVAAPGTSKRRWPTTSELRKAERLGEQGTAREQLHRTVRATATTAKDEADFFAKLKSAGIRTKVPTANGYAVALPSKRNPIWYGGGRLAADLSLPMLRAYWLMLKSKRDYETATAIAAVMKMAYRAPRRSR